MSARLPAQPTPQKFEAESMRAAVAVTRPMPTERILLSIRGKPARPRFSLRRSVQVWGKAVPPLPVNRDSAIKEERSSSAPQSSVMEATVVVTTNVLREAAVSLQREPGKPVAE